MSKARDIADIGSNDVIETSSTGVAVTGTIIADESLTIDGGTGWGHLEVGGDLGGYLDFKNPVTDDYDGRVQWTGSNLDIMTATDNPIRLRHATGTKLSTTASGIDVTGTATMDGLTVDGDVVFQDSTPTLTIKDADGTDQYFKIFHSGATTSIYSRNGASDGAFLFRGEGGGTATNRLNIATNGDISFYEDTGTTAKFFWDASAERLGIGTSGPSESLHVASGNVKVGLAASFITYTEDYGIGTPNANGLQVFAANGDTIKLGHMTGGTTFTERMRIDSAGRVTMPYQPAVFATCRGSGRANGVSGRVVYGNVQNNVGNHYNAGVFTAPIAGSYMVVASALNQQGGPNQIWIRKNGVQVSSSIYFNAYDETGAATACIYLQAGDYIDAYTPMPHYESDYGDFACHLVG